MKQNGKSRLDENVDGLTSAYSLKLHGWYYHLIVLQMSLLGSEGMARGKQTFVAQLAVLLDTVEYARKHQHDDDQVNG